jgi:glycosyltransferase involved in cell wall biosynthesis
MRRRGEAIPRLRWVGLFSDEARAELERQGLLDIVEVTGFVPQPEALSLMASATGLIACDFIDTRPLSLGTTPAKLFEYLPSGVPIVYVGHAHGEAARLLDGHPGCYVVPFGDVDAGIRAVQAAVADGVHPRDVASLTRRARSEELAALFDGVVDRHAGT